MDKNLLKWGAILLFPLYAIFGLLLSPLLLKFTFDAVLSTTVGWDVIYMLHCWWEPLVLAVLVGLCICGVARYGAQHLRDLYLLCGGALVFKYLSTVIAESIFWGSLDLTEAMLSIFLSLLLECLIVALSVLIAHKLLPPGTHTNGRAFRLSDPAQKAALLTALLNGAVRLVGFIIYDISFGWYEVSDIPFTILYLFLEIILPTALSFLVSVLMLRLFGQKKTEPPVGDPEI